jgi:TM2 domain-containing membrane protein YozV
MPDELYPSSRSRLVTLLLAIFLGVFGVHRFYNGKIGTGVLMILTLGGLGIWWLTDVIMISAGAFRDAEGRLVSLWDQEGERLPPPGATGAIFDELDQLRADVAELQERVDFAERMLADPDRRETRH